MRYSADHKEAAKQAILAKASARLRKDGIAAVGVRTLMADAGLTHGGFYAHFASRTALVAEAVGAAFQQTVTRLKQAAGQAKPDQGLAALIGTYLHVSHLTHPEQGCAAAALAPEIARHDDAVRSHFADALNPTLTLLAEQLPEGGDPGARMARARLIFANMMGTLQLARTLTDPREVEGLLTDGRAGALLIANQPWPQPPRTRSSRQKA